MSFETYARNLFEAALAEGRTTLLEPELYALLQEGGVETPAFFVLKRTEDLEQQLGTIPGDRAVVKVVSPDITHKTEMGGVAIVQNNGETIVQTARDIFNSVKEKGGEELLDTVHGVIVSEFVANDETLGSQLFAGMRFTPDMGHVLAVGFGGLEAEALAANFKAGQATTIYSPTLLTPEQGLAKFMKSYAARKMLGNTREARARIDEDGLRSVLRFFADVASKLSNQDPDGVIITDFEINPFFVGNGRIVAVDAFLRFRKGHEAEKTVDTWKIQRLLEPKTAAIMGVSGKKLNVGRVILRNLLREEFPREQIRIVRPGAKPGDEIDGVECVGTISNLPWTADLMVVAVGADMVPAIVEEVMESEKAHSLVLIPGGMGETEGGKAKEQQVKDAIANARAEGRFSPVMVGPNCLGVRSRPGRYDTLFIPQLKLPMPSGKVSNAALLSQSGAFMITRMNRIPVLDPPYAVSTGNQLDLTFTDFAEAMLHDDRIQVMGIYIEGFNPLDGRRLARLVQEGRKMGKEFVVYKAGRTSVGQTATSSHTASISGDYPAACEVLKDAGALMADTFEEFKAFLTFAGLLIDKRFHGRRLGLVSNAGYETVGMADNLHEADFELSPLTGTTKERLAEILKKHHLSTLVNVHNPLDLTPMGTDAAHAESLQAYLTDETVDALVACAVPMTVAMKTLPPHVDPRDRDTIDAEDGYCLRMAEVFKNTSKPMIVVVDAGDLYDPMAQKLEELGVPTFRSSDFAMQTFQRFLKHKLEQA